MGTAVILIAVLAIEHYLANKPFIRQISTLRSSDWLLSYSRLLQVNIISKFPGNSMTIMTIILLLPLLLAATLLTWLIISTGGAIGYWIWSLFLFYYCLKSDGAEQFEAPLVQVHEQYFALMFWLALLGPVGVFSYWLLLNAKTKFINSSQDQQLAIDMIARLHAFAAWIPARLTGLVYALVGDFSSGFSCWISNLLKPSMASSDFLVETGNAALITDPTDEQLSILIKRALVAWLVIAVVLSLIHFHW